MHIAIQPRKTKNTLATIAIGKQYFDSWKNYAFPSWKAYCERHGLGLIVFTKELISKEDPFWKKPNWQKLLIGHVLLKEGFKIDNICHLDTDILINPTAPNIFDSHHEQTISVISQQRDLPYSSLLEINKRIAFLRHNFLDKAYPLDSALFADLKQVFDYHNLPEQKDYLCTGVYVFNILEHSEMMREWFYKYPKNIHSLTGGGEEPHLNYEIQSYGKIRWLDYKFQALWVYEVAWKYPFLFFDKGENASLIKACVEASLFANYFLHFAGSWHESQMWKINGILQDEKTLRMFEDFADYLKMSVTGIPKGIIKPRAVDIDVKT